MKHTMQNQAGFSLLGVLIAVMIIGIVAAMAVPRLTSAITTANTSKIKADLSTLDTAIGVYEAEHGSEPSQLTDLAEYVPDVKSDKLKPPTGKYWDVNGKANDIPAMYSLSTATPKRAVCGNLTVGDFGVRKAETASTPASTGGQTE